MASKLLSVIIPAKNEKYLENTIKDVISNFEGDSEIIVVLDGWIPETQIVTNDSRVIFIHFNDSIGQRKAINEGVKAAKGKFIMKLDAHCSVDKGFDVKLSQDCEYDWTVIPRMYNLDVAKWQPKYHKVTDYMYIGNTENRCLRAEYYTGDDYRLWHSRLELIDDTMCCMGPGWFMHKDRFLELGGCDEKHEGGWGQQGVEVSLKTWLSGGSLKVNKKTWFAHYFRGHEGFPYPISGNQIERVRKYSRDLWLNNKWEKQTRKFDWLIDKFNPPSWEKTGLEDLKDKYKGEICYIVGRGTSIRNLTPNDFANGPVIALNQSIIQIERLNLTNPIYSMQKDKADTRPNKATLLVSKHESPNDLKDYSPRIVFNAQALDNNKYGYKEFSANIAMKIAQLFGCNKIKLMGFDSCMNGNEDSVMGDMTVHNLDRTYLRQSKAQCIRMKELISKDRLDAEWVIPSSSLQTILSPSH